MFEKKRPVRRRGAALQLKLALTLTLAPAAGGAKKPDMTHQGFENRVFRSSHNLVWKEIGI